jgi:tRNA splicing endonuclease
VALETTTFEDKNGRTAMRLDTVYSTVEDRDWVVKNGMEKGANWTYDRLEDVLKSKK